MDEYFGAFCREQVGRRFNMELPREISKSEMTYNTSLFCNCSKNWQYTCDAGIEGQPETFNTVTMDTLQNVEGRDFLSFLLQTTELYRRKRWVLFFIFFVRLYCIRE